MKFVKINLKKVLGWTKRNKFAICLFLIILSSIVYYFYYIRENQLFPEATLYFMNDLKVPEKGQKVLVFSPHPDDETIAVGGLMFGSVKNGADVKVVLVTDGNKHHLKDKRYAEFEEATSVLGVKGENLIFLNYKDGEMQKENQEKVKQSFKKIVDDFNPDFIFYPHTKEQHPDHKVTGVIVDEIIKEEKKHTGYEYLVHEKYFPSPKRFRPDDYILPPVYLVNSDVFWYKLMLTDEAEDAKNEAVLKYKTQLKYFPFREFLYAFIRKNEIFAQETNKK